jgi:hypothetical protein
MVITLAYSPPQELSNGTSFVDFRYRLDSFPFSIGFLLKTRAGGEEIAAAGR